ncbi:MAG TPA: aldo/keto reductase [Erysipelothrix sp.]
MKNRELYNGVKIPIVGLGTYKLKDNEAENIISKALNLGYRHFDTASYYENEAIIGTTLRKSMIPREEIFITTKVWDDDQGYEETINSFYRSLERLQTDYIDLFLIHWPTQKSLDTWRALEYLYNKGLVRAIGVSNFEIEHLELLVEHAEITPMVNQVERHPYLTQEVLYEYCSNNSIVMEAWSPLVRGEVLKEELVLALAKKYGKTPGQIILRWQIQTDFIVFPKTATVSRLEENIALFDFVLTDEEIIEISNLNKNYRTGADPSKRTIEKAPI